MRVNVFVLVSVLLVPFGKSCRRAMPSDFGHNSIEEPRLALPWGCYHGHCL